MVCILPYKYLRYLTYYLTYYLPLLYGFYEKIQFIEQINLTIYIYGRIHRNCVYEVYNTIIPRLIRLSEAPSHGKPIIAYDPKSRGAEAYLNLAKEVISKNGI